MFRGRGGGGGKGGKSGKGGGSGGASEAPNTLRSRAVARILDMWCEGEILGLVDGAKSVYFGDTALQAEDGTFNFDGVTFEQRLGTADQVEVSGFPSAENEIAVGTEIKNSAPVVVTTASADNVDVLYVTINLQALVKQDEATGQLVGSEVEIAIDVKPYGGAYIERVSDVIKGKTTSQYQRQYRIDVRGTTGPWDIRARRITEDSGTVSEQNKTYLASYTEVTEAKFTYPHTAYNAMAVDSQMYTGAIPVRSYDLYLRLVEVPSNYNPETRAYTGIWDGTFKTAWTDNPAWVLRDAIVNDRFGLGQYISSAQVDKWGLYTIAQYCDELVPDGLGGTEPRFTFNYLFQTRSEAYLALQAIASSFRGMMYYSSGTVMATQDRPSDPVQIVAKANIVGKFRYSGTALKAHASVAVVTWFDPQDACRPTPEFVEIPELISKYGWRTRDITAVGVTSRSMAKRVGKWILLSEELQYESLTYRTGWDHAQVMPGDIVQVHDPDYAAVRLGGRLAAATTTEITLDEPVTLQSSQTYTFCVMLPDGSRAERTVADTPGVRSVLHLTSALPSAPLVGAMWALKATNIAPRLFRVISVTDLSPRNTGQFEITALLHDPDKYTEIEQDIILADTPTTYWPKGALTLPSEITIDEYLYQGPTSVRSGVVVNWKPSNDPRVVRYEVQVMMPGENFWTPMGQTIQNALTIPETTSGTIYVQVRAVAASGARSNWVEQSFLLSGASSLTDDVTNFTVTISGTTATARWSRVLSLNLSHYTMRFSPQTSGADWATSSPLIERIPADQVILTMPAQIGTYLIKAVNLNDTESENAASYSTGLQALEGLNVVELIQEETAWSGAHYGTVALGGELWLDSVDMMSDWATLGDVDTLAYGVNGVREAGEYLSMQVLDLGQVYTFKLTPNLVVYGNDVKNTMDQWATLDAVAQLSGNTVQDWTVQAYARITNDDPAASPSPWGDWFEIVVGEYVGRGVQWKIKLMRGPSNVAPVVSVGQLQVDMPDRVASEENITVVAAGQSITFATAFHATPSIVVTSKDMATGDYYTISAKSRTGFTIRFFNASGTGVQRTMDWVAKGYGSETI